MVHKVEERTQFPGARAAPLQQVARTIRESPRGSSTRISSLPSFFVLVALCQDSASREGKSDCFGMFREDSTPGDRRVP